MGAGSRSRGGRSTARCRKTLCRTLVASAALALAVLAPVESAAAQTSDVASQIAERDALIAAQESLLNAYRCAHQIDTELVPRGCGGQTPAPHPGTGYTPASGNNNATVSANWGHSCVIRADQTVAYWGYRSGQTDPPCGRFGLPYE